MPAAYRDGEFSVCDSELQDLVGVYTEDGQVKTYTQEPEGTVPNPPYTPRVPKSSNCKTYASTELWAAVRSRLALLPSMYSVANVVARSPPPRPPPRCRLVRPRRRLRPPA